MERRKSNFPSSGWKCLLTEPDVEDIISSFIRAIHDSFPHLFPSSSLLSSLSN